MLLGVIILIVFLLATYLVWWWLWVYLLMVSAALWVWRLFIQFWAGVGQIMAYEYARGRQQQVQVCLVSVA